MPRWKPDSARLAQKGRDRFVDAVALIEECNQLDTELYRFGLGLFEEGVASAGNELEADGEALRARNSSIR